MPGPIEPIGKEKIKRKEENSINPEYYILNAFFEHEKMSKRNQIGYLGEIKITLETQQKYTEQKVKLKEDLLKDSSYAKLFKDLLTYITIATQGAQGFTNHGFSLSNLLKLDIRNLTGLFFVATSCEEFALKFATDIKIIDWVAKFFIQSPKKRKFLNNFIEYAILTQSSILSSISILKPHNSPTNQDLEKLIKRISLLVKTSAFGIGHFCEAKKFWKEGEIKYLDGIGADLQRDLKRIQNFFEQAIANYLIINEIMMYIISTAGQNLGTNDL